MVHINPEKPEDFPILRNASYDLLFAMVDA